MPAPGQWLKHPPDVTATEWAKVHDRILGLMVGLVDEAERRVLPHNQLLSFVLMDASTRCLAEAESKEKGILTNQLGPDVRARLEEFGL